MALDAKAAWLAAALGFVQPSPGADDKRPLLQVWREAKETVDEGIGKLQQACLTQKVPQATAALLKLVADRGLNGVTDRASVGMMAAMTEAESSPAAKAKALSAVETFQAFLKSPAAASIDENPLGVAVGMRTTFDTALRTIRARLAA